MAGADQAKGATFEIVIILKDNLFIGSRGEGQEPSRVSLSNVILHNNDDHDIKCLNPNLRLSTFILQHELNFF